jgi:hypothetical protein
MSYSKDSLAREFFERGYAALTPEHKAFIDSRFAELMIAVAEMFQDVADQGVKDLGGN